MKKSGLFAAAGALCLLTGAALADTQDRILTILTSPEPQTQLMAMVLTMQAAEQGADAHIMLCGPAADIALRDAPETATAAQPPRDMSPQGLMQMIRKKTGASVEVCAIYLPAKGADTSILLDGITAADPAAMAKRLLDDDTTVLSF